MTLLKIIIIMLYTDRAHHPPRDRAARRPAAVPRPSRRCSDSDSDSAVTLCVHTNTQHETLKTSSEVTLVVNQVIFFVIKDIIA